MQNSLFKRKDLYFILSFLLLAVCIFIFTNRSQEKCIAIVETNNQILYQFDLSKQATTKVISIDGSYHVALLLEPGAISFQHSDCHDQVCVRTGKLTKAGQVAVCLPAKISIRIVGGQKEYDGITG